MNLSAERHRSPAASGAVGERFADESQLDTVEVARKFYRSHGDNLRPADLSGPTQSLIDDAFAFESTVANEIRGIGLEHLRSRRATFGSAGRLRQLRDDGLARQVSRGSPAAVPRREQHRQRARAGGRASLAGVPRVPQSHRRALRGAARPRPGALELLLRLRRVGDGRERHRGSRRRLVPHDRRPSSATACSTSTRWASCAEHEVPPFFYVDNPVNVAGGRDARLGAARRASRSTARAATC